MRAVITTRRDARHKGSSRDLHASLASLAHRAAKMAACCGCTGLRKTYGDFTALHGLDLHIDAARDPRPARPQRGRQVDDGEVPGGTCCGPMPARSRSTVSTRWRRTAAGAPAHRLPARGRAPARGADAVEYLLLKGRLFDLDDAQIRASGERLLAGFGLLDRGDAPMVGFSKGMLQKVSIAAALLTEPKVLVFDEPLSGLDVQTTLVVKELMREFARRGGAVLHCSHLLDVVESIAHRIAVLDQGKLLACGTAAELRTQVGAGATTHLDAVFRTLVRSSDPVATAQAILG
jgi:hypothetical protein